MIGRRSQSQMKQFVCDGMVLVAASSVFARLELSDGLCKSEFDVTCPAVYRPVFCGDGSSYSNLCVTENSFRATGYESAHDPLVYDDGVTYSNLCVAESFFCTADFEFTGGTVTEVPFQP